MTTSYKPLGERQTMATDHAFLSGPEITHLILRKTRSSRRVRMATSFCSLSWASGIGRAREKGKDLTPESYKSYKDFAIFFFSNYSRNMRVFKYRIDIT